MTEIEVHIDYLDRDAIPRTHSVRSELGSQGLEETAREVTEIVTKDGFFLVMEEKHLVFIPPLQVLQVTFDLIDSEGGS